MIILLHCQAGLNQYFASLGIKKMSCKIWTEYGDHQKHLGCAWGILNSLNYHKWQKNVKRIMLPHKKWNAEKQDRGNKSPNYRSNVYHYQEVEQLLESEPSHLHACQSKSETRSIRKRSVRARIKSLVSEEKVKDQQGSKLGPSLQRTFSIHHLEPSDERLNNVNTKWAHPIIFLPKNAGSTGTFQEKSEKDGEYVGVLEIFKLDKYLFQNHTQKAEYGKERKSKAIFAKSGSFPVADFTHFRNLPPSKLESKQRESWFFKKGYDPRKVFISDILLGSKKESENHKSNEEYQQTGISPGSRQELDNKEINEGNQETGLSWDSTQNFEDQESNEKNPKTRSSSGLIQDLEDQSCNEENQESHISKFRRTPSLKESLENYTRLSDYNILSDKAKLNHSKSLKLSTEYEIPPNTKSFFSRIRTLTHLDLREESNDSHFSSNDGKNFMRVDSKVSEEMIYLNVEEHIDEIDYSQEEIVENSAKFQASKDIEHSYYFENDKYVPKSYPTHKADFDYVKALLELSGFADNAFDATWHSSEQPLGALVFEELESYWPQEPEDDDIISSYHHRENLFDLVNEVLLKIYEISFPYYPRSLSPNCRVRPFCGTHILDEVWRLVALPKVEPSLDSLVSRDFDVDSEWMNLQMESEFVGVEIDQLIFDELVEELMSS